MMMKFYYYFFKIQEENLLVYFDVKDIVKVEDILEYIKYENNKYIESHETDDYKPYWFYEDIDAVEER